MYHYVRDLKHTRYPDIKGLDINLFKQQILYLKKHYNFITMETLIEAIDNDEKLPEKSILLTFDDGYSDHFNFVFPLLDKLQIQGSFFPPAKAISEHSLLDVNKIHFILASEDDKIRIIKEIKLQLNLYRKDYDLKDYSFYYQKLAHPNRFDTAEVIFIKRLLQVELDEKLREIITNNIFEKIVDIDEESFSRELYMSLDQLKCIQRNGMHIGSHGYKHYWLGSLSEEDQRNEIEKSLRFLKEVNGNINRWTLCYPYGNYNQTTIELLQEYQCSLAVTTEVDIANIVNTNKYILPRLDTNDLPKDEFSQTDKWYFKG